MSRGVLGWATTWATLESQLRAWELHLQLRKLAAMSLSLGATSVLLGVGGVVTAHALGPGGRAW